MSFCVFGFFGFVFPFRGSGGFPFGFWGLFSLFGFWPWLPSCRLACSHVVYDVNVLSVFVYLTLGNAHNMWLRTVVVHIGSSHSYLQLLSGVCRESLELPKSVYRCYSFFVCSFYNFHLFNNLYCVAFFTLSKTFLYSFHFFVFSLFSDEPLHFLCFFKLVFSDLLTASHLFATFNFVEFSQLSTVFCLHMFS